MQDPRAAGLDRTRWWLGGIRQAIGWLSERCLATISRLLRRWDLHYRRGRRAVHSPDADYAAQVARLAQITWYSSQAPAHIVRLYQDEVTYYRRATIGYDYVHSGCPQARQGWGSNTMRRIAGCLDPATGRLHAWQRAHFDHETLQHFYEAVEAAYPQAQQIFLIQDNWPVHRQRELVQALRGSKLTLVFLPTYAPWLNPIEKVWRKLYAEVLHLHRWVEQWEELQAAVQR